MKRLSTIIMALVLALGLTQCKKEQPAANELQGETYTINLSVKGNNNAKVDVNTVTGAVDYATGDQIHVASGGKYVGTLTYNGTIFTGNIANAVEGEPLQFYFLGNVTPAEELTSGITESCSVVISDQTQHLPVISGAPSNENFYGEVSDYTAELLNKCALVKFNVTTVSEAATCLTGFNNKVTIDFGENTFSNSQEGNGVITLPAGNGEKWAILLPQAAMTGGNAYAAGDEYAGTFGAVPAIYTNGMFTVGVPVEVTTSTHNYLVDLSTLTGDYQAINGDTLTGTLAGNKYDITVAEGATVTLWNAQINPSGAYKDSPYEKGAGINCQNNATLLIEGTNIVRAWRENWPCIFIAPGKTLTIDGSGSLETKHPQNICAAIGARWNDPCGNIVINGGTITAQTGSGAAIGGGFSDGSSCGTITINGGTVNATASSGAAIGCGYSGNNCEGITITGGTVTATANYGAGIGGGYNNASPTTCGNITISGGNVTATSSGSYCAGIGTGYRSNCGDITISGGEVTASGKYVGVGCAYPGTSCGNISISNATVTATGRDGQAPGIGIYYFGTIGNITIYDNVVSVTATKGSSALNCIGKGRSDNNGVPTMGTITIGGTVYPDGATPNQTDGLTFVYPAPVPTEQIVDLSTITTDYTAVDGDILTGTLGTGVQISIADGATITLRSANINGNDNLSGTFHGLNCLGDATIILENNDNVVKANCGSEYGRAGIYVPRYKTLTFEAGNSSGFVVATGSGEAAGIGGYSNNHCGVIVINSGKVTGTAGTGVDGTFGDSYSAGIGSSAYKRCGGIIINGGQVIGTGYGNAAGIGTGGNGICRKEGDTDGSQPAITISNTLSNYVKAQKGSSATYFIGGGPSSKCGIVTVGGTTYEDGGGNRGISSSTSLSDDFTVSGNSLIYMPW